MNQAAPALARLALLLLALILGLGAAAVAEPQGEEAALTAAEAGEKLLAAVQRQDAAEARRLLAAGAEVDTRSRYGATPLFFACDKGDLELVELLLEHGATPDAEDTFYGATPLTWTLFKIERSPQYRAVALRLLAAGPKDAAAALPVGVREGDLEMVRAAVEGGGIEPRSLAGALAQAREAENEEIAAYLEARVAALEAEGGTVESFEVTPEKLASYAGAYRSDEIGVTLQVRVTEGRLEAEAEGQPPLALDAVEEDVFGVRELPTVGLAFSGRGGLVERLVLRQGERETVFARFEPEAQAEAGESAAGESGAVESTAGETPPVQTPEASASEPGSPQPGPLDPVLGEPRPWPSFRGPGASGIGDGQGVPATWSAESGENVRWKTPIPGLALSSPVVWGERVFVSTAVSEQAEETFRTGLYGDVDSVEEDALHVWKLYALDKATGKVLWQREAARGRPKVKRHMKSSHANPTPATDGRRVVVSFGSEGLFCWSVEGELLWKKDLGVLSSGWFYDPTYEWGFGSSPILQEGRVIVQVDVQEGSFLAAYDAATGEQLWRTAREEIPSWGTPAVLPAPGGGAEIVTNAKTVRGYDAATGEELWTLSPNSEITVASPVVAGGVAYVTGGYPPVRPIYAVKPGGRGDLSPAEGATSNEHVVWSTTRGGTYIPTPLVYRGRLYVLHNNGRLTAHDAKTGEEIYRARVGHAESFSSSPVAADGRLFFTTEEGRTYVVRAGDRYEVLATNDLDEVVMATPALSGGLMVMRGLRHVWGLGLPAGE